MSQLVYFASFPNLLSTLDSRPILRCTLLCCLLTSTEFLSNASDATLSASSKYPSVCSKEPKDTSTTSQNSPGTEVSATRRQSIALWVFPRTRQYKEARVCKSQLGPTPCNKAMHGYGCPSTVIWKLSQWLLT